MTLARAEVRAQALELRASALAERMDNLIAQETMFRQQITTNPNTPGAQVMAMNLLNQASAIDRDIAALNIALSSVPSDLRPYIGSQIGVIETAYLGPSLQRFSDYRTRLTQCPPEPYRVAFSANVWLQDWQNAYFDNLNRVGTTTQTIAQARWWGGPRVLGTAETFVGGTPVVMPNGSTVLLPSGASVYMPSGSIPSGSTAPVPPTSTLPIGGMSY